MALPARLVPLLGIVEQQTQQLRSLAELPTETLLGDPVRLAAVKYGFVVGIGAAIDVCRHLGVALGLRSSTSFADAFKVFGEAGFIEADLVVRLESMAKFRNVLVHGYAEVDDQRVVEILKTRLGDLDDFRRQIVAAVAE